MPSVRAPPEPELEAVDLFRTGMADGHDERGDRADQGQHLHELGKGIGDEDAAIGQSIAGAQHEPEARNDDTATASPVTVEVDFSPEKTPTIRRISAPRRESVRAAERCRLGDEVSTVIVPRILSSVHGQSHALRGLQCGGILLMSWSTDAAVASNTGAG